jgi:AraC-like DNA-binding protein/quercetin dioxygenase-like cupin family protein
MMRERTSRALYQRFLPDGPSRAFVWKYSQAIGGRRPRHFHAEPELNLIVKGSATFALGEQRVRATRGDLLAFASGQEHALLEASPDLYLYAVGLDARHSAYVLGGSEVTVPFHVRLDPSELERVEDRAAAIVDRSETEQLGAELWERVHWLGRNLGARAGHPAHVLTRRALQRLHMNPELSLDALARALRAQPSEVSRHFHRDVGTTLVRHRTRLRLLEHVRLVDAGAYDLMSAARAAGFGSYSQCHRAFQAELGHAPSAFFAPGVRERMQGTYDHSLVAPPSS